MEYYSDSEYLKHYGILGMKWGVRRFQNPDGSLTAEGIKRYGVSGKTKSVRAVRKVDNRLGDVSSRSKVRERVASDINNNEALRSRYNKWKDASRRLRNVYAKEYNSLAWIYNSEKIKPDSFSISDLNNDLVDLLGLQFGENEPHVMAERDARRGFQEERDRIIASYLPDFTNALLVDIPNDGSKEARAIIQQYSERRLSDTDYFIDDDSDYLWVEDPIKS